MGRMLAGIVLLIAMTATAVAEPRWQSLDGVRAAVEDFLADELEDGPGELESVTIDRLDPRLKLKACTGALEPSLPRSQPSAGRLTVAVRCHEPTPWRVYVPVRIVIQDELRGREVDGEFRNQRTMIEVEKPSLQEVPNMVFTRTFLERAGD